MDERINENYSNVKMLRKEASPVLCVGKSTIRKRTKMINNSNLVVCCLYDYLLKEDITL